MTRTARVSGEPRPLTDSMPQAQTGPECSLRVPRAAALRRNYLIAYVGHQAAPGEPMTVLHRACLDWSAFVRTSGWHGIDAATNAGTTYGM